MKFSNKEKLYIKEQIMQEVIDLNVKLYGLNIATQLVAAGIDIRVNWNRGYKRNSDDVTKPLHLNYIIPYDWRKKFNGNPYAIEQITQPITTLKYNEWGYYYMSTLDYERRNKLNEILG